MARVRDYAAENAARNQKAKESGFKSYYAQRKALEQTKAQSFHPGSGIRQALADFPTASEEDLRAKGVNVPKAMQGPNSTSPSPDWDYYWPTRTSNAMRPRTSQARYSRNLQRLEVMFDRPSKSNPGGSYIYEEVSPGTWNAFKRNASPGRFINAELNNHPYEPGGWGSIVGE